MIRPETRSVCYTTDNCRENLPFIVLTDHILHLVTNHSSENQRRSNPYLFPRTSIQHRDGEDKTPPKACCVIFLIVLIMKDVDSTSATLSNSLQIKSYMRGVFLWV